MAKELETQDNPMSSLSRRFGVILERMVTCSEKLGKVTSVLANLIVIVGLLIAFHQLKQHREFNQNHLAIDAVRATKDKDFQRTLMRLRRVSSIESGASSDFRIEALDSIYSSGDSAKNLFLLYGDATYIINRFDYLALLYFNTLGDGDILYDGAYPELRETVKSLDGIPELKDFKLARRNVDDLLRAFTIRDWQEGQKATYEPKRNYPKLPDSGGQ